MEISRVKTDTGIEVIIYNSAAGGAAPIHGAYLANQRGFKWVPWSWNFRGESFPLRIHDLDITLAIANEEVNVTDPEEEKETVVA